MELQPRIEYPGAIYHVMARGARREYLSRIEAKGLEDKGSPAQPENQSLQSTLV